MLGVTGPNEYENNINNNFYTSYLAQWCFNYTVEALNQVKNNNLDRFNEIVFKTNFKETIEVAEWKKIASNVYFPRDEELGIYLQQDGYLDKEQILVKNLPESDRPLNQKWSHRFCHL